VIAVVALLAWLQSGRWAPDERVLISDFSHINAVAASPFTLFAATPRGLLVYDRLARRWSLPVTTLDGYPRALVGVALADATDDAVWLGTSDGWARYDARLRQWQSGPVAGGVVDLALDPRDAAGGVYLRGAIGGWSHLPRGGLIPFGGRQPPVGALRPLEVRMALAQAPQADALRALLLTDARLRSYQFTAAARSPDQSDLFLGTNGLGVIRVDAFGAGWDALAFGLPAIGAAALAAAPDGIWVGAVPRVGEREGLAWVGEDLGATRWLEGSGARGLGFREARRLVARPGRLWVVTERGVSRLDPGTDGVVDVPVADATSLAPAPDGVWVGTRRGLVLVSDSGRVVSLGAPAGDGVLSLCPAGDSVWVGTAAGLALLAPGLSAPRVPAELLGAPGLSAPIVALARLRDTLVAATPDQLAWRAPSGRWTLLRPGADLGRLTTLTADRDGVWVGGAHGLAFWRVGAGTFRALRVPADLPAGVRDVAVAAPYLWVATDSGLVRFHREAAIER
jgi:ligand-binding sensor domain-containing protein